MTWSADTLLVGASVRTLDARRPRASAVAVAQGVVVALDEDALAMRGAATEVIDLGGATLVPGLVDGHSHPILGATAFDGLDLSGCGSLDDLRAALAGASLERGEWLCGFGLDHNVFDGQPPTNAVLDEVLPGVPVFIRMYDGHSALASSAALERAGVSGPRSFGQRSAIVCDDHGRPTGLLLEHAAIEVVESVVPPLLPEQRRARVLEALQAMAATGLTGANVMDGSSDSLDLLADLENATDLPVRLRLAPWCMPGDDVPELVDRQGRGGRGWYVGAVKLYLDGTVEGGTAWLHEPDCHGGGTEAFWLDPVEYTKTVQHLAAVGVQTCTHAIGDAAVRHVVDTLDGVETHGVRHRVEHLETMPIGLVRDVVGAGLVASMQPSHAAFTRADHTDEWSRRLGEQRANRAWACRDVRDAGGLLVIGSDWPIAHYDARQVLGFARARRPSGTDMPAVGPEQALTGLMALEGMTTHAAVADGRADSSGHIAVGYRADLTALAVDPVDAPADEVVDATVNLTMMGGAVTHRDGDVR
ncbi:MAG: amidohydrolase [Nocardioides sp.]|uniref:amidohydrolase n=1 Tax=Nocardioides sp. TaxID=35761 RepID=UPI003265B052